MENNNTTISSTKNDTDHETDHITGRRLSAAINQSGNVGRSDNSVNFDAQRSLKAMAYIKANLNQSTPLQQCDIVIEMASVDAACVIDIDLSSFTGTFVSERDYEVVIKAREMLAEINIERIRSKATPPSSATIADYKRKCKLLDHAADMGLDPGTSEWLQKLAPYAPKMRSFFAMRAAASWRALDRLQSLVLATKDLRPNTQTDLSWHELRRAFAHTLHQCNAIKHTSRDICLDWSGRSSASVESKKQALRQLPDGWRDQFIAALGATTSYRAQTTLLRFAGFRPRELEMGVTARLYGGRVELEILGAKVRAVAGQEWRKVSLDSSVLPSWLLVDLSDGKHHVYKAAPGAMRKYLNRVSERLFPRKMKNGIKTGPLVSAYVFRHALASDLSEEGWTDAAMASVLGESVAETSRWYGLRVRTRSKKKITIAIDPNRVETARVVRASKRFDPKTLGLNKSNGCASP